jgi:hypothetical protein
LLICLEQRLSGELEHSNKVSLCLIKHDVVPYEEMEVRFHAFFISALDFE